MTAYERVLDALHNHGSIVKTNGIRAMAQCPAHDDRNPSLGILATETRAALCCYAGCKTADVIAALGLTWPDLYNNPRGPVYKYDSGRLIHRTMDKQFIPSGNKTAPYELYRLAKVKEAVAAGVPVYLVEGEEDVHAIEAVGAVATTGPGGATNIGKCDLTPLYGADVIAVVDRDESGDKWAAAVRDRLNGHAKELVFQQAAAGKDASDHVAAGHGLDDFRPYQPAEAPPADPSVDEPGQPNPFLARAISRDDLDTMPAPEELIEGLLPRRGIALLFGPRGLGKTLCALSLAGAASSDLPDWNDYKIVHHGPFYYIALEGWAGIPERVRAWEIANGARMDNVTFWRDRLNLKDQHTAAALGQAVRDGGYSGLIVDSVRAAGGGRENTEDMGAFVNGLETIRQAFDGLVIVLHNSGWNGDHERGSTLLGDAADTILKISGDPHGVRILEHTKHRDGEELDQPIGLTFRAVDSTRSGVLARTGTLPTAQSLRDQVLQTVITTPGQSSSGVNRELGRTEAGRSEVSRLLTSLRQEDLIDNHGTTTRPKWWPAAARLPEERAQ